MRRTVLALSVLAGIAVFCFMASAHGGELDSLNQEIAVQSGSLYSTWYGSEIQTMPVDSIPGYLSFLLSENRLDTITAYKVAQKVQHIASLERKAAHLKASLDLIPDWQASNEVRGHSHTVVLIDRWLERPAEPVIKPVKHKLQIDEIDPLSDILNN